MASLSAWYIALTVTSVLLPLAFLLAVLTFWRAQRAGALAVVVSTVSALLAVGAEVASVMLWLRVRESIAALENYNLSQYPSICMGPDDIGRFSPPPGYFSHLLRAVAQVAPLERAAKLDVVVAFVAIAAIIACALLWGRRRAPAPQAA